MANEHNDQIRIVQETVAGKEITFAHVMGGPAPISWICRPFYRNDDHYRRNLRCHVRNDGSRRLFPRYAGICGLQYYQEIGSKAWKNE